LSELPGYTPGGRNFDAILVGYYDGRALMFVRKVRAGFTPTRRASVFREFQELETERCPFKNLPEGAPRSGTRGTDCRRDGEVPLAETTAGPVDRIPGTEHGNHLRRRSQV
jgi:hypothetical protein